MQRCKIKSTLNEMSKIYKYLNMTRKQPKYHITKSIKFIDELIEKRKIEEYFTIYSLDEFRTSKLNCKI